MYEEKIMSEDKKYKVIRNWNGTECKTPKIIFDKEGMPIGCEVEDIYTGEKMICEDYTFEPLDINKN